MKFDQVINRVVKDFSSSHYELFNSIGSSVEVVVSKISDLILAVPPLIWILIIGSIFFYFSSQKKFIKSIVTTLSMAVLLIFEYWEAGVYTISLVLYGTIVSLVIGLILGVLMGEFHCIGKGLLLILDIMQTLPSFIYLLPSILLFGIGTPAAFISIVIYSIPPVARLTCLGITEADSSVVESSVAYGATRFQTLFITKIPLAINSILVGVNQTLMMAISMVVTASMVGAKGLGAEVLSAVNQINIGKGLRAGVCIIIIAVISDRLIKTVSDYFIGRKYK